MPTKLVLAVEDSGDAMNVVFMAGCTIPLEEVVAAVMKYAQMQGIPFDKILDAFNTTTVIAVEQRPKPFYIAGGQG